MKKLLQRRRKGVAVPLAMIAVMILLAMGVGLLSLGANVRIFSIRTCSALSARSAADAGLTMALFEMNEKLKAKPWKEGTLPQGTDVKLPYSDAVFSYKVAGNLSGGYVITSVGKFSSAQRTVNATLAMKGLYDNGILTKAGLILKPNTVLDGYNSLDALDTNTDADIATQSTTDSSITLNNGVVITGDVRVGLGGDSDSVIKDLGAAIGGSKYAARKNEYLPEITAPTTLFSMGTAITAKGDTVTITPAESGKYTGIALKADNDPGVLEISGGDVELYITGNIDLGNACEIVIKDGSSLTIYVDGDIACDNGSNIGVENASKDAKSLILYGTGEDEQEFDLKAKSEWVGVVYAPNADITLFAGGDVFGAIIANNFEFKAGGNYHYDRALKKVSAEDEGVRFVLTNWNEN